MRLEMRGVQKLPREKGNSPFLGTGTHTRQSYAKSPNSQKLATYCFGEENARAPIEGE